jgi:hypothetical protein
MRTFWSTRIQRGRLGGPNDTRWREPLARPRHPGSCGDPGLPSGIPVMHTIHDPRKTVVNPYNWVGIQSTSSTTLPNLNKSYIGHLAEFKCHTRHDQTNITIADVRVASVTRVMPTTLQVTDQETDPNSHWHRRTHHYLPRSPLYNLTKLIARDKAMSTF